MAEIGAEKVLEDVEIPGVRDVMQKRVMGNNRAIMIQWKHLCLLEAVKASAGKDWKHTDVLDLAVIFYGWLDLEGS